MSGLFSDSGGPRHASSRRGFVLIVCSLMLAFILIPAVGLAIDVGLIYLVQTRLSAAADAAALAGARALSRGSDDPAQRVNAQNTANTYFNVNFPSGYFFSTNVRVNSVAATDSTFVRSITTTASVDLPLLFMRLFNQTVSTINASAKATRRDVNVMIVMDRSGSLQNSGSCSTLKAAAVNFVDRFAEGRDNMGLVTFATSSRVDFAMSGTFKTSIENTLNNLVCTGGTSSAQALWQGYQQLIGLNQAGALNVILFFTDGRPTAVTANFPLISANRTCNSAGPLLGALTLGYSGSTPSSAMGLYDHNAPAQPFSSDLRLISAGTGCRFASRASDVDQDVAYAPLTDYYGNSLTATGFRSTTTRGAGLDIQNAQNVENFSVNAADHAGLRIRRGDPDPTQGNRSIANTMIFSIGLGNVDDDLLMRISNDPALSPNPVSAGVQGRYVYAANSADLEQAFTRVASEILRLAR